MNGPLFIREPVIIAREFTSEAGFSFQHGPVTGASGLKITRILVMNLHPTNDLKVTVKVIDSEGDSGILAVMKVPTGPTGTQKEFVFDDLVIPQGCTINFMCGVDAASGGVTAFGGHLG
jgi:hypothetical protein